MAKEFLGRGWAFPLLPDATGTLRYTQLEGNVHQSIRILLMTRLGERVMRPDLGTEAPRLVFAPGSEQNLNILEETVDRAIRLFEPRVDLLEVRAELDSEDDTRAIVSISYKVRRTNTRNNLVFPFYLGRMEAEL